MILLPHRYKSITIIHVNVKLCALVKVIYKRFNSVNLLKVNVIAILIRINVDVYNVVIKNVKLLGL